MKVKLKEVCEIKNGYAFKSEEYVNSGIRVIRITNVQKGYIEDENPQFYPIEMEKDLKDYMLKKDDLLISLTGNVGRVALLGEEFLPAALNQRVGCIRVNKQDIDIKYIFYNLLSKRFEDDCIKYSKGIAQKNMSTEWLKEYEIVIKSVEDQNKVVRILDILQSSIKKYKMLLSYFDTLIKARFVEMFGDVNTNKYKYNIERLDNIAEEFFAGGDKPNKIYNKPTGKSIYPVYANGYENEGLQGYSDVKRVSKPAITISARGTIGYCFIRHANFTPIVRLITIVPNDRINLYYLKYSMEMMGIKSSGTSQAQVTVPDLKKEMIIVPPIDTQNDFADFVKHIDKLKFE